MKVNDKELYIKLPLINNKKFVTLPTSGNLNYDLLNRDDIKDIGNSSLSYLNTGEKVSISSFSLPITTISGGSALNEAFYNCPSLINVDLSSLTTIGIDGSYALIDAFRNCSNLRNVDLSSLTTINSYGDFYDTFNGCSKLTNINLNSLRTIAYDIQYAFRGCTGLNNKNLYFPSLVVSSSSASNMFNSMLSGVTGCTVHFPASLQSVIGEWEDVTNGFGGTNTTVLFDLNGGRMAYTYVERIYYSDDPEDYEYIEHTIYTADNTDVLQSPSVGDTMYTKSANNIYSSESTIKSIEGNKIYLNDRNIQTNYDISSSLTLDLLSITSIQLSLYGRPYTSHTLVEFLDISDNVLSSSYLSSGGVSYQVSSMPSETKYLRVSPNTSAGGYAPGSWRMTVTSTSYKTYPEPFKRDGSKDIINYVS